MTAVAGAISRQREHAPKRHPLAKEERAHQHHPNGHGEGDDQAEVERKRADVRAITWKVALAIVGFEIVVVQQLGMS